MKTIFALAFLALGAVGAWLAFDQVSAYLGFGLPELNRDRLLTDQSGRTVAVRILGRDADEVQFVRLSDERIFRYPIAQLSASDQSFVRKWPITELSRSTAIQTRTQLAREDLLKRRRAELNHRISLLTLELQKVSDKSPEMSREQIEQKINECRNEIIDLEQELKEIAFAERSDRD